MVFRESKDFKNVVREKKEENMFLDINELCKSIKREKEYILMCFLVGNDFLPHMPSINLRTHGLEIILETYKRIRSEELIKTKEIDWKWFKKYLCEIAKNEKEYILNEYFTREKMEKRRWECKTKEEIEELITNIPIIQRQDEKYICPEEHGWEKRYYKSLFGIIPTQENIKSICMNYLEGLEWVFKYYTKDCPDWKWKYNYHYPPLLSDLIKYIPNNNQIEFIRNKPIDTFHTTTQLAYVLPYDNLYLLGEKGDKIKEKYSDLYPLKYGFKWAFCRYFWEAHPILPEISLDVLNDIENI
jgi:5'-3' exoribonuclease 2